MNICKAKEEFYTGGQPVCVVLFLQIIGHQQDFLKEQGT